MYAIIETKINNEKVDIRDMVSHLALSCTEPSKHHLTLSCTEPSKHYITLSCTGPSTYA